MAPMGKQHSAAKEQVDRARLYDVGEAVGIVRESAYAKFDESVDLAVRLGVNPKYADQMVRGSVSLPHGTGKQVRVIVFAKGEKVREALDAGADEAGEEDLVEKIKGGWFEFDKAVATPDMMGKVGPLGRLLGPRGLMPNPKAGTVTFDVASAVQELKAGRIEFRVDKAGIVHVPVGRVSFEAEQIAENVHSLMETLIRMRPASAKGTYVRGVALSSTMGPGIKLNPQQFALLR